METSGGLKFLEHKEDQEESVLRENGQLPSQWRPVPPPRSNPGTNSQINVTSYVLSERIFIGRNEITHPRSVSSFDNN